METLLVHTFPEGISLKVNVIARLEFERIYFETVALFRYYATRPLYLRKKVSRYELMIGNSQKRADFSN